MGRLQLQVVALLAMLSVFLLILSTPIAILVERGFNLEGLSVDFIRALLLSLLSSLLSASINVLMAAPLSFYISRRLRGRSRRALYSILMLPAILTPSATGSLLLLFFTLNPAGAFINNHVNIVNSVKGVVLANLVVAFPTALAYLAGLFMSVPRVYEELAMEAGMGSLSFIYKVLFPMLKKELSVCYLLTFSRAFSDFGASLILGGGIRGRTWTLPILIYATTYVGGYVAVSTIILIYVALGLAMNYFLSGLEEGPRW
jgi:molybdate transport system permease protein